jgi:hypothetical protein
MSSPATRIRFAETYPALYILFGTNFFVGAEDGLTDAEVLADFRAYVSATEVALVRTEMSQLLAAESTDWEEAAHQAWRYFATPAEIRDWLVLINKALLT